MGPAVLSSPRRLGIRNVGFLGSLGVFEAVGGDVSFANIGGSDYKIHTFPASDSFSVLGGKSFMDYLIVGAGAGAGGGDNNNPRPGGGGGAGGLIQGTLEVGKGVYPVSVGPTTVNNNPFGFFQGADSSIFGVTAFGGGFGAPGTFNSGPGGSGGSGGGGARSSVGGSGFAGPPQQGFNGGQTSDAGAGGGAGGSASGTTRGPGMSINFSGSTLVYALGGLAGPLSGGNGASGTNGRGNGGNGGGGNSGNNSFGGSGGSGIVVVRYLI